MDGSTSFFTISIGETSNANQTFTLNKDPAYVDVFHQSLPPGSLLETDDVIRQFLSFNEPIEEPDLNGPTTLHCEICQKKFDNARKYYGHLRIHSKSKAWVCDKCPDQKFSTKQQLMKHSLIHKPLEKIWKCPQCPMVFEVLFRLQQHLFSKHLNYRPHKCDKCDKAFSKLSDLKKHQLSHGDLKEHECPVCMKRFKDKSNMKRHFLRHNNDKPYRCTGCGTKFQQVSSLKRHTQYICRKRPKVPVVDISGPQRFNYCKVCGEKFQYKTALVEHFTKEHSSTSGPQGSRIETPRKERKEPPEKYGKEPPSKERKDSIVEKKVVDDIVDDILSVEDDYSIMNHLPQNVVYNKDQDKIAMDTTDNLMHIELFKDMNQLHNLDDELFYNDLDFDSFHQNHVFNTNEIENQGQERNGEVFDFPDTARSMDQDLMNALYHVKPEHLPDELLNVSEENLATQAENFLGNHVSMNECATIFETDVDLDASTNLAANLNQLIGENNVHYVSTEDDDTFIISLNNEIDAEKLTDILNISEVNCKVEEDSNDDAPTVEDIPPIESIVLEIPKTNPVKSDIKDDNVNTNKGTKKAPKPKMKRQVLYICRVCKKMFARRDNYRSHLATHDTSLRRHKCEACGMKFGYKSTLNKHMKMYHIPLVEKAVTCEICDKQYSAQWILNNHIKRDHQGQLLYKCTHSGCDRKFYLKADRESHVRLHTGERPYECAYCARKFRHRSAIIKHVRKCTKKQPKKTKLCRKKKMPQQEKNAIAVTPTVMKYRTANICDVIIIPASSIIIQ